MRSSQEIGKLALALSKAQGELTNVAKKAEGYGYNYAELGDILNISRPILAANELSVTQITGNHNSQISVETILMHSSGEWIAGTLTMEVELRKGMSMAQNIGSVITYARRYSYAAIIGITQHDDDARVQVTELQKATFHELVEDKDAVGLFLTRKRVGDDQYIDLCNSAEKGNKVAFKSQIRELEPIGQKLVANLELAISEGDDLLAKESLDGITDLGFKMLVSILSKDEREWITKVNNERLSEKE